MLRLLAFGCASFLAVAVRAEPPPPVTPASVIAATSAADWASLPPDHLMVMDVSGGGRVVILLAPDFAPAHISNIEALVRAHWFDGLWIERVQDGYVTQWGDPTDKKPLAPGASPTLPAEYERAAAGMPFRALPYRDTYAAEVGWSRGWPVAREGGQAWLTHCYGMVGVGRDKAPDTGSGVELYAVIGQAPRGLDRNIALVGRVLSGMEYLTALPRGTEAMGFYKQGAMLPITRVRMASELPVAERPALEMLRDDSASFGRWVQVKANRRDDFFVRPAGAIDLCNALPPVREAKR